MRTLCSCSVVALTIICAATAWAQTVPAGFSQSTYKSGMGQITAMAWAKDGADDLLFATQKTGEIRVIKNGALQGANVATVGVTTNNECGLDNVIVDPSYGTNKFIYVFATVNETTQRVLRFTITNGASVGVTGAPMQIGPDLPTRNQNHDGGGMAIGADGFLYVGIGNLGTNVGADGNTDPATGEWVSYGSKILRMNRMTGAAVNTNPWFNDATHTDPKVDYFFAKGFRNPFGLRIRPGTSDLWLTEVGDSWEQVFLVTAGSTQGYPTENNTNTGNGKLVPVLAYATNSSYGGCLTRGAFYTGSMFPAGAGPAGFSNTFFFIDYKSGKLMRAVLNGGNNGFASHAEFVTGNGANTLTDVNVGPDGALYYSSIGGMIFRLSYTGGASQSIVVSTSSITITEGSSGTFQVHLAVAPPGNVTVNAARSSGSTDVTVTGGATLTFTTANWSTNQTVTVAAAEDADFANESATIQLTSAGLTSVNVTVNVMDNDVGPAPMVTIDGPAEGQVVSGTNAEFYGEATTAGTLDYAEFYVDGVLKYTDDFVPAVGHFHYGGSHLGWNTTALSNGKHRLMLKVFDTLGQSGSATVNVKVDNSGGAKGLRGEYHLGTNFGALKMVRIDPTVNFTWGQGSPDTSLPVNGFSVRWTGEVTPGFSETYTFYVTSDDGARLWVNGTLLVDRWVDQGASEYSGSIALTADVPASIVLEYYENGGDAVAQFRWSSPSTPKGIIPTSAMGTESAHGGGGGSGGGGGMGCGLTGLEGVIGLGLAAAFRRRRR
jgi:glucose/arabinose dehydrogenase